MSLRAREKVARDYNDDEAEGRVMKQCSVRVILDLESEVHSK